SQHDSPASPRHARRATRHPARAFSRSGRPEVIEPCDLPPTALLRSYRDAGAYIDCYATEIAARVSHSEYVEAFYTTFVFKLERLLLKWLVSKPSTDTGAARLARGELDSYAAWTVEGRAPDQVLM